MTTQTSKHEDTRSAALIENHQALATKSFKEMSALYLQQVKDHPEHAPKSAESAEDAAHQYRVEMTVAGFLYAIVTINFYDASNKHVAHFKGEGGGLVFGGGGTWGIARLNRPIQSYRGENARFYADFVAAFGGVSTVKLWRMNGEVIGSAIGGGVGAGAGIFGGEGPITIY